MESHDKYTENDTFVWIRTRKNYSNHWHFEIPQRGAKHISCKNEHIHVVSVTFISIWWPDLRKATPKSTNWGTWLKLWRKKRLFPRGTPGLARFLEAGVPWLRMSWCFLAFHKQLGKGPLIFFWCFWGQGSKSKLGVVSKIFCFHCHLGKWSLTESETTREFRMPGKQVAMNFHQLYP